MKREARVLVTSAGGIVAHGIMKSLRLANSKVDGPVQYKIVATDQNAEGVGLYRSDAGLLVPPAGSPEFVSSLIRICKDQRVDAIFVASDEELLPIVTEKERIEEESEAVVITNPKEVIEVGMDKWKTSEFLKDHDLSGTESSLPEDQDAFIREFGFPLVVKPREGHGSLHLYVVRDADETRQAMCAIRRAGWRPMIQEYLPGDELEFTTGVTVDMGGKEVMSSICMRRKLKSGQTNKAFIDDYSPTRELAESVALELGSIGPVNVQSRLVDGRPKIFEINPRFSSSSPIRAVAGVNEPDIVFRNMVLGEKIKVCAYEKLVCFRYWNEVYLPRSVYDSALKGATVTNPDSTIPNYF